MMWSRTLVDSFRNWGLARYILLFTLGLGGAGRERSCFGCGDEGLSGTMRSGNGRFERNTQCFAESGDCRRTEILDSEFDHRLDRDHIAASLTDWTIFLFLQVYFR